jgi:hypothetical protein
MSTATLNSQTRNNWLIGLGALAAFIFVGRLLMYLLDPGPRSGFMVILLDAVFHTLPTLLLVHWWRNENAGAVRTGAGVIALLWATMFAALILAARPDVTAYHAYFAVVTLAHGGIWLALRMTAR